MKQYTTIEQLDELSDKGRKALGRWVDEKSYWIYKQVGSFDRLPKPYLKGELPLLSIGQLIEFLLDAKSKGTETLLGELSSSRWGERGKYDIRWFKDEELCDTLWADVKRILEDE